jgi:hypothetical protein
LAFESRVSELILNPFLDGVDRSVLDVS